MKNWLTWLWRLISTVLPSVGWRPRKVSGVIPVGVWSPEHQGSWCGTFQSKGRRKLMFQLSDAGRKKALNSFFLHFWFYSNCQEICRCLPTMDRAVYFTESVDSNANLIWKYLHWHTRNSVSGCHVTQSSWHKITMFIIFIWSISLLWQRNAMCSSKHVYFSSWAHR